MPQPIPISAQAKTLAISVTATASASQALPSIGNTIRIVNEGPNTAFVSIGASAQTATLPATSGASATATSTPVLSGEDVVFTIPDVRNTAQIAATLPVLGSVYATPTPLNISAICRATGTAVIDVQVAEGQ